MVDAWISLRPEWSLQDVQAGLNVTIALISAGALFVLVRYCWMIAAQHIAKNHPIPAHSLLSLNTIGEVVDVIWLLRYDLFTSRYQGLLFQTVFVILLTVSTLLSGFIARFATRHGQILKDIELNGTLSIQNINSIPYAEWDINITLSSLREADFPQNQLIDYLPDSTRSWRYVDSQWRNSTWSMNCQFEDTTQIKNPVATSNCSDSMWSLLPFMYDKWQDFEANINSSYWTYDHAGWTNNGSVYRDWIIFAHGLSFTDTAAIPGTTTRRNTAITVRTVYYHLMGLKSNDTCSFGPGRIPKAEYTSMNCLLTRNVNASMPSAEVDTWGANPDGFEVTWQAAAYIQHYGNLFRKQSSAEQDVTVVSGPELAKFYQAYLATKDTSSSKTAMRTTRTKIQVPQINIICVIVYSVAGGVVLLGVLNYWIFLYRHWHRLNAAPQSKLDWMLQTLRKDQDDKSDSTTNKNRLSHIISAGDGDHEGVPLTHVKSSQAFDRRSVKSTASSTFSPLPGGGHADDGFDTPILSPNFNGRSPNTTWFPQQFERMASGVNVHVRGSAPRADYNPVQQQQSPYMWQGSSTFDKDTSYDAHR